jgi:hypothetical protein
MKHESFFYNCSPEYLTGISPILPQEIAEVIDQLPRRSTHSEISRDIFWALVSREWSYDSLPTGLLDAATPESGLKRFNLAEAKRRNIRDLCRTSTTLGAKWRADYAKLFSGELVQIEVQFGKVEAMFKDFCGFRISWYERRLALGIQIVMCGPANPSSHRKQAIPGIAHFDNVQRTLPTIGLDCPIWVIGVKD